MHDAFAKERTERCTQQSNFYILIPVFNDLDYILKKIDILADVEGENQVVLSLIELLLLIYPQISGRTDVLSKIEDYTLNWGLFS